MRTKKAISILLLVCMLVSVLPLSALTVSAAPTSIAPADLLAKAVGGSVLTLDADYQVSGILEITGPLTIDLNGHTLSRDTDNINAVTVYVNCANASDEVNIVDNSAASTGAVVKTVKGNAIHLGKGTLNIGLNGGTNGIDVIGIHAGITVDEASDNTAFLNIYNGTNVSATSSEATYGDAVRVTDGNVNICSGVVLTGSATGSGLEVYGYETNRGYVSVKAGATVTTVGGNGRAVGIWGGYFDSFGSIIGNIIVEDNLNHATYKTDSSDITFNGGKLTGKIIDNRSNETAENEFYVYIYGDIAVKADDSVDSDVFMSGGIYEVTFIDGSDSSTVKYGHDGYACTIDFPAHSGTGFIGWQEDETGNIINTPKYTINDVYNKTNGSVFTAVYQNDDILGFKSFKYYHHTRNAYFLFTQKPLPFNVINSITITVYDEEENIIGQYESDLLKYQTLTGKTEWPATVNITVTDGTLGSYDQYFTTIDPLEDKENRYGTYAVIAYDLIDGTSNVYIEKYAQYTGNDLNTVTYLDYDGNPIADTAYTQYYTDGALLELAPDLTYGKYMGYDFAGWELIEGTLGADDTVTGDLVYKAIQAVDSMYIANFKYTVGAEGGISVQATLADRFQMSDVSDINVLIKRGSEVIGEYQAIVEKLNQEYKGKNFTMSLSKANRGGTSYWDDITRIADDANLADTQAIMTITIGGTQQQAYADVDAVTFTVEYQDYNGNVVPELTQEYSYGAALELASADALSPLYQGYDFDKWVDAATGADAVNGTLVTANMTFKAAYIEDSLLLNGEHFILPTQAAPSAKIKFQFTNAYPTSITGATMTVKNAKGETVGQYSYAMPANVQDDSYIRMLELTLNMDASGALAPATAGWTSVADIPVGTNLKGAYAILALNIGAEVHKATVWANNSLVTLTYVDIDGTTVLATETVSYGAYAPQITANSTVAGYKIENWNFDFTTPIFADTTIKALPTASSTVIERAEFISEYDNTGKMVRVYIQATPVAYQTLDALKIDFIDANDNIIGTYSLNPANYASREDLGLTGINFRLNSDYTASDSWVADLAIEEGTNLNGVKAYITLDIDGQKHYRLTNALVGSSTVFFHSDDVEGSPFNTYVFSLGSAVTAPDYIPEKTGFTFGGWGKMRINSGSVEIVPVDFTAEYETVDGTAKHYYPVWVPNVYTLTYYDSYNGKELSPAGAPTQYTYGADDVILPGLDAVDGVAFYGWQLPDGRIVEAGKALPNDVYGNLTLTAIWSNNVYTITYFDGDTHEVIMKRSVIAGTRLDNIQINANKVGHTFYNYGYYEMNADGTFDPSRGIPALYNMPERDIAAVAYYTKNSYNVHYYIDGEIQLPLCQTVSYGTAFTAATTPEKVGYTFSGWTWGNDGGTGTQPAAMPARNLQAYGYYIPNTITVKFYEAKQNVPGQDKYGNAEPTGEVRTYTYDALSNMVDNKAAEIEGFTLSGWMLLDYTTKDYIDIDNFVSSADLYKYEPWPADANVNTPYYKVVARYTRNTYNIRYVVDGVDTGIVVNDIPYNSAIDKGAVEGYSLVLDKIEELKAAKQIAENQIGTIYNISGWVWSTITAPANMPAYDITLSTVLVADTQNYTVNYWTENVGADASVKDAVNYSLRGSINLKGLTVADLIALDGEWITLTGFTLDTVNGVIFDAATLTVNLYYTRNTVKASFTDADGNITWQTFNEYGGPINVPSEIPTKDGHTFTGWAIPKQNNGAKITMPEKPIVIYPSFEKNEYKVVYYVDDPNVAGTDYKVVAEYTTVIGGNILHNAPHIEGFKFIKWVNGNGGAVVDVLDADAIAGYYPGTTISLYAVFERESYNLNVIYYDTGKYTTKTIKVPYDAPIAAAMTAEGIVGAVYDNYPEHAFIDWIGYDETANMPAHDVNIVAEYDEGMGNYRINYFVKLGNNAYVLNYTEMYNHADGIVNLYMPEPPVFEGYTLINGWHRFNNGTQVVSPIDVSAGGTIQLYAEYSINSYSIDYQVKYPNSASYKSTLTTSLIYNTPTSVLTADAIAAQALKMNYISARELEGYTLSQWKFYYLVNGQFTEISPMAQIPEKMPAKNVYARAEYVPNEYTVRFIYDLDNYDPADKTSGYAVEETYFFGDSTIASLVPADPYKYGYVFEGWDWNNDGKADTKDDAVAAEFFTGTYLPKNGYDYKNVYAVWTPEVYNVTFELYYYNYSAAGANGNFIMIDSVSVDVPFAADLSQFDAIMNSKTLAALEAEGFDFSSLNMALNSGVYVFTGWFDKLPAEMPRDNITVAGIVTMGDGVEYELKIMEQDVNDPSVYNHVETIYLQGVHTQDISPIVNFISGTAGRTGFGVPTVTPSTDYVHAYDKAVIEVKYPRNTYTLTYRAVDEAGNVIINETVTYKYDQAVVPHAIIDKTAQGYAFNGWFNEPKFMPATNDLVVTGTYVALTYKIHYDFGLNLGNDTVIDNFSYLANPTEYKVTDPNFVLGNPSYKGLTFMGWVEVTAETLNSIKNYDVSTEALYASANPYMMVKPSERVGDIYFLAVWKYDSFTVRFHANYGSIKPVDVKNVNFNSYLTLNLSANGFEEFERTYYALTGWSYNIKARTPDYLINSTIFTNKLNDPASPEFDGIIDLYAVWTESEGRNVPIIVPVVDDDEDALVIKPNTEYGNLIYQMPTYNTNTTNPVVPNVPSAADPVVDDKKDTTKEHSADKVDLKDTSVASTWNNPFTDVSENASYYNAVRYVYTNGLFKGMSATEFGAETTMTRAMFVTVLGRLINIDASSNAQSKFTDVSEGEWYSAYVNWAAENNLVVGYYDGRFGPNDVITREQMMVIMYRFAIFCGFETGNLDNVKLSYRDMANVSDWAIDAVKYCKKNNLMDVTVIGNIYPQREAKRHEVAEIIYKFMEYVVE